MFANPAMPGRENSEATLRARRRASASESATMCTTPDLRPCADGPPRASMSTCSPVTDLTTSGPVTNTRPSGAMITMSVSAGP